MTNFQSLRSTVVFSFFVSGGGSGLKITASTFLAEAQVDLCIAIGERQNTVLMLGLDCSPDGPVDQLCEFLQIFDYFSIGKRWASF